MQYLLPNYLALESLKKREDKLTKIIGVITIFLISSCSGNKNIRFTKGRCIQEINNQVASFANNRGHIYKLLDVDGDQLKVAQWYNNGWYYLKERDISYFDDTKHFSYVEVGCPDNNNERRSIKDTVKNIKFD